MHLHAKDSLAVATHVSCKHTVPLCLCCAISMCFEPQQHSVQTSFIVNINRHCVLQKLDADVIKVIKVSLGAHLAA